MRLYHPTQFGFSARWPPEHPKMVRAKIERFLPDDSGRGNWTSLPHEANPLRRPRHRCGFVGSSQFSRILVHDFTKTAAKQFRELALGDAPEASLGTD
jgi:hypothetical protein